MRFIFSCLIIVVGVSMLINDITRMRNRELITRLDRLTAIAVMDSARVDSLMTAHDYTWPKRGTR